MPRFGDDFIDLTNLKKENVKKLPNEPFRAVVANIVGILQQDRKENQLLYYQPASDKARAIHFSKAKWVGVSGGNRSSKTETCVAHMCMLATGVFPQDEALQEELKSQFRGPINCRMVVESFTTTLYPIILPKFKYSVWTGADEQGGERGHWGWIPKTSLIDGSWDRSWSEKIKVLTVLCKDPDTGKVLGNSQIQFMSKDQDSEDFASGTFHLVLHDEPPLYSQWRENQARTMDTNGRIFLAFTWPDDPTIPVDWVYDELYDLAQEPNKSPDHDWFELWTTENKTINQESVSKQANQWSEETKRIRLFGGSMRFSNRIHPLFTDSEQYWCFDCKQVCYQRECSVCQGDNIDSFCHVQNFDIESWPCVFLLDPHPRKPHMYAWAQITPSDDIRIIADGECQGGAEELVKEVFDLEEQMKIYVGTRLIDPLMGRSPASSKREITWQDEFDKAGLLMELADNSSVGREKLNTYLKPDEYTLFPRFILNERCHLSAFQMKRYVWDDFKTSLEKDLKQKAKAKNDDYPTLFKYLMNFNPSFTWLNEGAPVIKRAGRKGVY